MKYSEQATNSILMVHPVDFEFNSETAADNEFQQNPGNIQSNQAAIREFETAVQTLQSHGLEVLVLEKDTRLPLLPDAVFPNNWFATDSASVLHIFPMKTPNRRAETSQLPGVLRLLDAAGFEYRRIQDWRQILGEGNVLEGTGSLIIDRSGKRFFGAVSERTQEEACKRFEEVSGMKAILFHTRSSTGNPYYHTNVVMSIGPKLAVACLECIPDAKERKMVREELGKHHSILEISISQLEKGFCGNLLQVLNKNGDVLIVMSETAFQTFSEIQKNEMSRFGRIVPLAIPVIEQVGGGSIRCMMAEIFCPRKDR